MLLKIRWWQKILILFFAWRILLTLILITSINLIPLNSKDFLGGGYNNYINNPYLFSWANFDGEHYLSIAQNGYANFEQAFFPLFPLLIKLIASAISYDYQTLTIVGLVITHLSFLLALIVLYKLIKIDFSAKVTWLSILLILIFPTSFYYISLYTESLFLLFTILAFYFARKNKWFLASVFGAFASATRVIGILILPALVIEAWKQKINAKQYLNLLLIPIGLLSYMIYLYFTLGNPVAFYGIQKMVGEQRQSTFTFLPQVFIRYIKMLALVDIKNPIYQTIFLEFISGVVFLLLPFYGFFKKIRVSYLFFALVAYLVPTTQGSFSSVPRYNIVLFPSFIALALLILNIKKIFKYIIIMILLIWQFIETALFLRGYWVA